MTAVKYRVARAISDALAEDQGHVAYALRTMYEQAAQAGCTPRQDHRIAVVRSPWGYIYEMRWVR